MSDQARMVIFVVVALAILLTWQHFYKPQFPPPQSPNQPAQQAPAGASQSATAPSAAASAPAKPGSIPTIRASEEKTIVVESPLYRVEVTNHGAVVRSWKLKKYSDDQKPPHPLELVNTEASQQLGWPFSLLLSDPQLDAQANSALYAVTPESEHLDAPATINFHWSDGHLDVTKTLKFDATYQVSLEVSATLDGKPLPVAIAWRGGFGDKAVYQASQLVSVFYKSGGKLNQLQYKKLGVDKNQSQPVLVPGPLEFTGLMDQFFTAAFLPDGTDLSLWDWTQYHNPPSGGESEPEAEMAAGTPIPGPLNVRVFVGPKDLAVLEKTKPPLEELVQFGWTGVIAKPLLFVLQWLHHYIPNYGWAIVMLTLVINFAMFPLKMKSWRSMQEMQKIAPEMRQIQDRYKKYKFNDPRKRKMQDEMMELYQKHGVSPMTQMGGCLPMVFQMPIWWALWRVLNGAIELRHAPWLGWIHDLSAKDPYYILPIAMTITMYLMTKMTPQTAAVDPSQQKMMQLMPLIFGVMFFRLSSGLNLYMFTSNIVGVGQQWYLNRTAPLPSRGKFKKKTE
jgi:YidC/Oxa1 family membrane protein insertase